MFPLGRCWLFSIRRLLAAAHLHPRVRTGAEARDDTQVYIDFLDLDPGDCPPTPALTRYGRRRTARTISDASFQALAGATRRRDVLEYWVHVLTDDERAYVGTGRDDMHITRLELVAAAHNLLVWPPGNSERVELVADNMASCDMINAGVARRDPSATPPSRPSPASSAGAGPRSPPSTSPPTKTGSATPPRVLTQPALPRSCSGLTRASRRAA